MIIDSVYASEWFWNGQCLHCLVRPSWNGNAEQIIIIFLCSDKCQTNYKFGLTLERVDWSYMQHNKGVILIIKEALALTCGNEAGK